MAETVDGGVMVLYLEQALELAHCGGVAGGAVSTVAGGAPVVAGGAGGSGWAGGAVSGGLGSDDGSTVEDGALRVLERDLDPEDEDDEYLSLMYLVLGSSFVLGKGKLTAGSSASAAAVYWPQICAG